MSKGLEALENIIAHVEEVAWQEVFEPLVDKNAEVIKQELKALEIIKSKIKIKLDYSISGTKGTHYFIETQEDIIPITKEEYELLKEVLL